MRNFLEVLKQKRKRREEKEGKKNTLCTFEKGYGTFTFLCRPSKKSTVERKLEILTNVFGMHIALRRALPFGEIGI